MLCFLKGGKERLKPPPDIRRAACWAHVRRKLLFIGDVKADPRGANFYSMISSCLRRGLNPRAYLHWLFTRVAAEGTHAPHTLTPAAYAALTQPAGKTAQAA